jgi:uncharacterized membrane protein
MVLGAAVWQRARGEAPVWTTVVYTACSRVCHQKPERSFHFGGTAWPVCGRCSGLYFSAPFGALAALVSLRRRQGAGRHLAWLAVACVPTAFTLGTEWAGLAAWSNLTRALAALPAGVMLAFVLVRTAARAPETIE